MKTISKLFKTIFTLSLLTILIYTIIIDNSKFGKIEGFNLIPQYQREWCWAANIQMIDNYFGGSSTQCSIAHIEDNNCNITQNCDCSLPDTTCNFRLTSDDDNDITQKYVNIFNSFSISTLTEDAFIDFDLIQNQINRRKPVLLSGVTCNECGNIWDGHAITVSGYVKTNIQKFIYINDPWGSKILSGIDNEKTCIGCNYYLSYDAIKARIFERTPVDSKSNRGISSSNISSIYDFKKSSTYTLSESLKDKYSNFKYYANKYYNKFFNSYAPLKIKSNENDFMKTYNILVKKSLIDLANNNLLKKINIISEFKYLKIDKPIIMHRINCISPNDKSSTTDVYIIKVTDTKNAETAILTLVQDKDKSDFYLESISTTCYDWLNTVPLAFSSNYEFIQVLCSPNNSLYIKGTLKGQDLIVPIKIQDNRIIIDGNSKTFQTSTFNPYSTNRQLKPTVTQKPLQQLRELN